MRRHWQKAFLSALANSGSVTQAAEAARIDRSKVYFHRRNDPAFAREWDEALDQAADVLEQIALNRAKEGTSKGSDTLLMFLLKGIRPQKWRESRATIAPAELNRLIETELQRISKQKEAEALEPVN